MDTTSPPVAGIHHLKFPVSDLDISLAWYTLVLSATHLPELDHFTKGGDRYAVELQMPAFGKTVLELRLNKNEALKNRRFDPVTWGVNTKADLENWAEWLDGKGVKRSRLLKGAVGWLIVFEDPDGRFLRLYTYETHEMTADVDDDTYWLSSGGN